METHLGEIILTIVVLSFWFLFPIGMFLSVSHVDKNTDQIIQFDHHRHWSTDIPADTEDTDTVDSVPPSRNQERPAVEQRP